ncbi:MAG TPA: hypothetical protein VMV92_23820 [Streptosporangiaceae bacterium]|nr:hypothetical protein [Streptosporangiaceae bacterium]
MAAGLPDEAMPGLMLAYDYQTGDPELDTTALEVRRLRREADEVAAAATARTSWPLLSWRPAACRSAISRCCWGSARSVSRSSPPKPAERLAGR